MNETKIQTPESDSEYLDDEWFERFVGIEDLQVFQYFYSGTPEEKANRADQRAKFESGEIDNPELGLADIDIDELKEKEAKLVEFKKEILDWEPDPNSTSEQNWRTETVKQLYHWSINERLAENLMVQSAFNASNAETEAERTRHMRQFERFNRFIYGEPDRSTFGFFANQIREEALEMLDSSDEDKAQAGQAVLDLFPEEFEHSVEVDALSDAQTHTELREQILEQYGLNPEDVEEIIKANKNMTPEELVEYFISRHEEIPGTDDFVMEVDEAKLATTFNPAQKKLSVPTTLSSGKKRTYTAKGALELEMHENQGHLQRSARGYTTGLKLLGFGLDRNVLIEEGSAILNQSAVSDTANSMTGADGVLAVGLARGIDAIGDEDQSKRDFRQTHDALKTIYKMRALKDGKSAEDAEADSSKKAWNKSVRVFRGTTADVPGVVFMKDKSYGEGFLETHMFVDKNTKRLIILKLGRFNPTLTRHINALLELEILDDDIAQILLDGKQ